MFTVTPLLISITCSILYFVITKDELIELVSLNVGVATLCLAYHIYADWKNSYIKQQRLEVEMELRFICMQFDKAYSSLLPSIVFALIPHESGDRSKNLTFSELSNARILKNDFESGFIKLLALKEGQTVGYGYFGQVREIGLVGNIIAFTEYLIEIANIYMNEDRLKKSEYIRSDLVRILKETADSIVSEAEALFKACKMDKAFMENSNLLRVNQHLKLLPYPGESNAV